MSWQGPDGPNPSNPSNQGGANGPVGPGDPTGPSWPSTGTTSSGPGDLTEPLPAPPPPGTWATPPPTPASDAPQPTVAWAPPEPVSRGLAVPGAPGLVFAGGAPRAAAFIIDMILVGIVASIISAPFGVGGIPTTADPTQLATRSGVSSVVTTILEAVYFVLLWSSSGRATLGMRLFGLQVGNAFDGAALALDQAVKRWVALGSWLAILGFVPGLAALAGLLQFAWSIALLVTTVSSPTKQGLHDRIANTAVVRPANAGNGLAITCLVLVIGIPILIVVLGVLGLAIYSGGITDILSAVGESV